MEWAEENLQQILDLTVMSHLMFSGLQPTQQIATLGMNDFIKGVRQWASLRDSVVLAPNCTQRGRVKLLMTASSTVLPMVTHGVLRPRCPATAALVLRWPCSITRCTRPGRENMATTACSTLHLTVRLGTPRPRCPAIAALVLRWKCSTVRFMLHGKVRRPTSASSTRRSTERHG